MISIHFIREIYLPFTFHEPLIQKRVVNYTCKMNGVNLHFELYIGNACFIIYVGVMAERRGWKYSGKEMLCWLNVHQFL